MSAKVHRLFQIYVKVTFRHMTYVKTSFKVSYTTLTAAWKYTFIKGYHLLFRCQRLSRAGAGRSTVHHFMTVITSTHLLRRPDSLTCTALHSAANYFLFQAGCCTDSDSDTFSNSVWRIFIFYFKKKAFESRRFNHMCIFFVFFPAWLFVLTTWLLPGSHIKSSLKVWISHSLLMQNWLREISERHLRTSRESSPFSIVNNLNGCLKGWSRRETVAAALCFFQRPSKCAWLCGEKGNNCLKKWWFCFELLYPVLLEGNSCFLLDSIDSF